MKSVQNDMTVGSPMKMILSFTFPIFLGYVIYETTFASDEYSV